MPDSPQKDIYKELLFPLCEFLINKKQSREGKGENRAINIPISEFETMLDATFINVPEYKAKKWELLKRELEGLADEYDPSGQNCLFRIESMDVLNALAEERPTEASKLKLRYSRSAMEAYLSFIETGDKRIDGRMEGLIASPPTMKGKGLIWKFGDSKTMHIKPRKGKDARVRVCLLLYGKEVMADGELTSIQSNNVDDYPDYKPGDEVTTDLLAKIMFHDEWESGNLSHKDIIKTVTTAINELNKRAKGYFGREAFRLTGENLVKLLD